MPTNVSYEFEKARTKYAQANSLAAKLAALQEMARTVPKHKGTESMRADISRKTAKTKKEIEKESAQAAKRGQGASLAIKKEGAGQIVLVGAPNSGKSTVLQALTKLKVEIASYPFTTTRPQVGMINFAGANIQLVELPAIVEGSAKGKARGNQLLSIVRAADAVVLVLDARQATLKLQTLLKECKKAGIRLNEKRPAISIQTGSYKGLSVSGKQFLKISLAALKVFLKTQGIHHGALVLNEPLVSLQQVQDALDSSLEFKKALALVNFKGLPIQPVSFANLETIAFSNPQELVEQKEKFFLLLDKVLVYTKKPGQKADLQDPLVLPKGSTRTELARMVHKELAQQFRHAKLYGKNARFPGQRIPRDYPLQNFDVVEIS